MKKYNNGNDLSEKILAGVNKLADNVASTMGPGGRNASSSGIVILEGSSSYFPLSQIALTLWILAHQGLSLAAGISH